MSDTLTFYAIRKDKLVEAKAPAGVKKFLDDFFEQEKIFGIDCLVAIGSDHKAPWLHAVDEEYQEGLTKEEISDTGIYTWLRNHPEVVFKYNWS